MKLLIDIGNTRIKWGTVSNNVFAFGGAVDYHKPTLTTLLSNILQNLPDLQHIFIANVNRFCAEALERWMMLYPHYPMKLLQAESYCLGVTNAYREPEMLGIDRWAAMIGAWQQYPKHAIAIFNAGTCVTVDVIDSSGQHVGGYIAPGLELMRTAIAQNIGLTMFVSPKNKYQEMQLSLALANNTQDAISHGSKKMVLGFIEKTAAQLRIMFGRDLTCILTGGVAADLLNVLIGNYTHHPYLVLQGMAAISADVSDDG